MRTVALALLAVALLGCDRRIQPHTHLWTDAPEQSVWTYEPVARFLTRTGEVHVTGFIDRRLAPGDSVTLSNGVAVSFDGAAIRVRDTVLQTNMLNCVVGHDGSIDSTAFIRTFD